MNFRAKNSNITKVLYIVLVLCIVSIMFLSIYSIFNQDKNQNNAENNNLMLNNNNNNNNDGDSEDAILDIFRKKQTEPPTQPQTQPPTQKPTEAPKPTEPPKPITESNTNPPNNQQIPRQTERTADIIEPLEDAVEVLSVPAVFMKPVSGYVSRKHNPDLLEYCIVMNDYRTHTGIDIDSEVGVNVKAVSDGIIADIYDDPLMGKTVVIEHYGNVQSIYMNLQQSLPKNITVGASVKGGDTIGGVGATTLIEVGDVPHLHFEMKKDGDYADPYEYINF